MLDQLLSGAKDGIIKDLAAKLGLNPNQASGFLQKGLSLLESALKGGKIDLAALTGGNASGILNKLDLSSLTTLVGGDTAKARTGMESILGPLMSSVKSNAGGAEQLLGQLTGAGGKGGVMGQISTMAGKLFSKS